MAEGGERGEMEHYKQTMFYYKLSLVPVRGPSSHSLANLLVQYSITIPCIDRVSLIENNNTVGRLSGVGLLSVLGLSYCTAVLTRESTVFRKDSLKKGSSVFLWEGLPNVYCTAVLTRDNPVLLREGLPNVYCPN